MLDATMSHETPGKAAKLRASCDACNESKVRCSQTKPKCSRCEKQGGICVYGLSRRSHKCAPRVGESYTAGSTVSSELSSQRHSITSSESEGHSDTSMTTLDGASTTSVSNMEVQHHENDVIGTGSSTQSMELFKDSNLAIFDFANFESLDSLGSLDTLTPFHPIFDQFDASAAPGMFEHQASLPSSIRSYSTMLEARPGSSSGCQCLSQVVSELLSIPLLLNNETVSFDAQLSQLKRAIQLSHDSIRCNCITDEMAIMTIGILVGRIIQGFESTLNDGSTLSGMPPSTADSMRTETFSATPPRLSWGVLQIEDDDENKLKEHLWLLYFQKLERLLSQFNNSVRMMRSRQGTGNSTHVMACECIHMWLERRAQIVRDQFASRCPSIGAVSQ